MALVLGACSGDSQVGSDQLLNVRDQIPEQRLGEATTTVAPEVTTTAVPADLGIRNTTSTRPPAATVTTRAEIVVTINADQSAAASQFDPNNVTVFVNFPVRWVNNDTVPRSIVFDGGARRSPPLAPGQSWSSAFDAPGTYNYQDGTRPYAVASVTVVAR